MAPDARKALGSAQLAGTFVSPKGHTLTVTADEVAIVKGKHGWFKPKVGTEVIARASRSDLAGAELDGGVLKAAMRFDFADGSSWEFEIPKIYRGTAEQVVRTLMASAAPLRPDAPRA